MKAAYSLAEEYNAPMHMHLSETRKEVYSHMKATGRRPVEWLNELKVLKNLIAAHVAWVTSREINMLKENNATVVNCPSSNTKLANGATAPVGNMDGLNIALGTDSTVTNNNLDILEEAHLSALMAKHTFWDPTLLDPWALLEMLTVNPRKTLGIPGGEILQDMPADIVLVNLDNLKMRPLLQSTMLANLFHSAGSSAVDTVISQGKLVMENRRIKTLDLPAVMRDVENVFTSLI